MTELAGSNASTRRQPQPVAGSRNTDGGSVCRTHGFLRFPIVSVSAGPRSPHPHTNFVSPVEIRGLSAQDFQAHVSPWRTPTQNVPESKPKLSLVHEVRRSLVDHNCCSSAPTNLPNILTLGCDERLLRRAAIKPPTLGIGRCRAPITEDALKESVFGVCVCRSYRPGILQRLAGVR